jgi:hypothetical protein
MSNDVVKPENPEPDDGFSGSVASGRVAKGRIGLWSDSEHWHDRDGLPLSSPLLVLGVTEVLRRWQDNVPDYITDKPLPDPADLNACIPQSEWQLGIDGKLRPPWEHTIVVYLVDPVVTGEIITYQASTRGAHIAYDNLREAVITMRALRGARVLPVVELAERPFPTNYGMRTRPHFQIIDWRTPADGQQAIPPAPATPQLMGPPSTPTTPQAAPAATTASAETKPKPEPKPETKPATATLEKMGTVKPVSTEEYIQDSIPW